MLTVKIRTVTYSGSDVEKVDGSSSVASITLWSNGDVYAAPPNSLQAYHDKLDTC